MIGDITTGDHLDRVVVGIWILMSLLTGVKGGGAREMIGGVRVGMIDSARRGGQLRMSEEVEEKSLGIGMLRGREGGIIGGQLGVEVLTGRETEIARGEIVIGTLTGDEEKRRHFVIRLGWEDLNMALGLLFSGVVCMMDGLILADEDYFRAYWLTLLGPLT